MLTWTRWRWEEQGRARFQSLFMFRSFLRLTQHALSSPGVVVPGAYSVLDVLGDLVGVHVVDAAVHRRPKICLTCRRCSYDVSHLRAKKKAVSSLKRKYIVNTPHTLYSESSSHLPDQTGEDKDADEEVQHLEGDLKGGDGLREAADVDQTANSEVVTAQVPVDGEDGLADWYRKKKHITSNRIMQLTAHTDVSNISWLHLESTQSKMNTWTF